MTSDERPLPAHVTMPLLELVTRSSLDQDYAAAAARKRSRTTPEGPRRFRTGPAIAVLAAFGLLVGIAFVQTRSSEGDRLATRNSLIQQIEDRRAAIAAHQDRIGRLRVATARLARQYVALDADAEAAEARLDRLRVRTGSGAVQGPGVRIVIQNPLGGLPTDAVRDSDLALLVDGLWNAGAEAIAINGRRLSAQTAIRNSAAAIHVGGQPLSPPYLVEAIGDPRTLQANLINGDQGIEFFNLARSLGFGVDRDNVRGLRLPAAEIRPLRYAHATTQPGRDEQ